MAPQRKLPQCSPISFSPINCVGAPKQTKPPQGTLLSGRLDNHDPSFDLCRPPVVPVPLTSKLGYEINQSSDGHDGVALDGPTRTRRKPMEPGQSQSLRPLSKVSNNTCPQISDRGRNEDQGYHKPLGLQMTTPPDSTKRKRSRAEVSTSRKQSKHNPPFQSPAIIKPSISKEKEPVLKLSAQPLIQYQGFTTTERQLSLTKTTLEALAAFRYNPSGAENTTSNVPTLSTYSRADMLKPSPRVPLQHGPPSNPYLDHRPLHRGDDSGSVTGCTMIDDPFTSGAGSVPLMDARPTFHSYDGLPEHSTTPQDGNSKSRLNMTIMAEPRASSAGLQPPIISDPHQGIALSVAEAAHSREGLAISRSPVNDISEVEDTRLGATTISIVHDGAPLDNSYNASPQRDTPQMAVQKVSHLTDDTGPLKLQSTCTSNPSHGPGDMIDILEAPKLRTQATTLQPFNQLPLNSVEIRQPGLPSSAVANSHTLKSISSCEELGRGFGYDSPVVTPSSATVKDQLRNGDLTRLDDPVSSPTLRLDGVSDLMLAPSSSRERSGKYGKGSENIVISYPSDDDYHIDEEEEMELLKLSEPSTLGEPRTNVPASIGDAIDLERNSSEVYNCPLQLSPLKMREQARSQETANPHRTDNYEAQTSKRGTAPEQPLGADEEDWNFVRPPRATGKQAKPQAVSVPSPLPDGYNMLIHNTQQRLTSSLASNPSLLVIDDSHEYLKPKAFARPIFPKLIPDRCPVVGLSSKSFLRVCFRIGEMYKEGVRCDALGVDAIIELFARVGVSSREPGTTKQHFQFLDLWHDRPPFATGILASCKATGLSESESRVFLSGEGGKMARCLGRFKRDPTSNTGWLLQVVNIRPTDWEEIGWTRRIVSGDDLTTRQGHRVVDGVGD